MKQENLNIYKSKMLDWGNENLFLKYLQLEALDLLTATMNLVNMLKIPEDVKKEHEEKMKSYETDPTRKYKIVRWCGVDES